MEVARGFEFFLGFFVFPYSDKLEGSDEL